VRHLPQSRSEHCVCVCAGIAISAYCYIQRGAYDELCLRMLATAPFFCGYHGLSSKSPVFMLMLMRKIGRGVAWLAGAQKQWDYIRFCKQADGSPWLLGQGRYGKVYKGVLNRKTNVAVKTFSHQGSDAEVIRFNAVGTTCFVHCCQ
jgi:hypothetical protein